MLTRSTGRMRLERRLYYCQSCGWNSRSKKAMETHMIEMHNQEKILEQPPRRSRTGKKKKGDESGGEDVVKVDEKPLVIDLSNAKWMVK